MATITQSITLRHRGNLGEEAEEVSFEAGAEVSILREWREHYLCKDSDGRVFNIRKELVDAG